MYERKVNGKAGAGEFLGANIDYYTITTSGSAAANDLVAKLDRVVEVISLNGQPIILGTATTNSLRFAIEHTEAWMNHPGVAAPTDALAAALLAHAGVTATVTRNAGL